MKRLAVVLAVGLIPVVWGVLVARSNGESGGAVKKHETGATEKLTAGDHQRSILVGQRERRYRVHVPKNYEPAKSVPVIIAYHGGGGNPVNMIRMSGLSDKSEREGFVVVYPFGTGKLDDYLLTFNGGGCCGYAMENKIDDVEMTRMLLDDLASVVNVDADRVYATGMSNGGMVSYLVASELSDRIAAIGPVGGPMMTEACRPSRPVSVIHFHGTADENAPFNGGYGKGFMGGKGVTNFKSVEHSINAWIKANQCSTTPTVEALPDQVDDGMKVTRKTWSGGRDNSEVVLVEIDDGGHTWPGQEPPLWSLGKSTKDISANDLMWEFFKKHPRSGRATN